MTYGIHPAAAASGAAVAPPVREEQCRGHTHNDRKQNYDTYKIHSSNIQIIYTIRIK